MTETPLKNASDEELNRAVEENLFAMFRSMTNVLHRIFST